MCVIDVRIAGRGETGRRGTSQRAAMTGSRLTAISASVRRVLMLPSAAFNSERRLDACLQSQSTGVGTIRLPCRSKA